MPEKILIIDDEQDIADLLEVYLKKGSILNIGVEEKKVEHKSPKSCRIESSNLIFTGGVYALQGLYNKNTGYGTHEG